jgi:hypothetical protein
MLRDFSKAVREVWNMSTPGGGAYRPDLHYMRGPGPKWRAKYGNLCPKTSTVGEPGRPAPRDLAQRRA